MEEMIMTAEAEFQYEIVYSKVTKIWKDDYDNMF